VVWSSDTSIWRAFSPKWVSGFIRPLHVQCIPRNVSSGRSRRLLGLPSYEENIMARKYIDCREFPSEINCSIALSADSEKELLEAAAQHAVTVHKHTDSPELRAQLKTLFHDGTPPVESPRHA
ncbi:DUF1059 domain-containing protein, partial [Pseudomonas sp. RTC3]|nr:DUF1059 domain-containing protein [Pseudomonas sp. RTC3]MEB0241817.1 DUF1059 domain-containing protein [Pseudomonas sp. 5C2]